MYTAPVIAVPQPRPQHHVGKNVDNVGLLTFSTDGSVCCARSTDHERWQELQLAASLVQNVHADRFCLPLSACS